MIPKLRVPQSGLEEFPDQSQNCRDDEFRAEQGRVTQRPVTTRKRDSSAERPRFAEINPGEFFPGLKPEIEWFSESHRQIDWRFLLANQNHRSSFFQRWTCWKRETEAIGLSHEEDESTNDVGEMRLKQGSCGAREKSLEKLGIWKMNWEIG